MDREAHALVRLTRIDGESSTDIGIPKNAAKGDLFVLELIWRDGDEFRFNLKRVHISTDIDLESLER